MTTGKYVPHLHIYREGCVNKGGNSVVSFFINHFKYIGYFSCHTFVELTIIFDNCTGQNKSKIAMSYIICQVDTGVFHRLTLLFLFQ